MSSSHHTNKTAEILPELCDPSVELVQVQRNKDQLFKKAEKNEWPSQRKGIELDAGER